VQSFQRGDKAWMLIHVPTEVVIKVEILLLQWTILIQQSQPDKPSHSTEILVSINKSRNLIGWKGILNIKGFEVFVQVENRGEKDCRFSREVLFPDLVNKIPAGTYIVITNQHQLGS